MMRKFYENKGVMAVLSFILALVLFVFVKTDRYSQSPLELFQNVSEVSTETVSNVPVHIEGDVDRYYVTGLPETVTVRLTGPSNIIERTLESQNFRVVTEDLSELEEGSHYIQLRMDQVSDSIKYEISPSSVNITLEALQTQVFPVSVNVTNPDAVASGYEIIQSTATPAEVTVSGSQATIDKIANVYVNATLPENASEDHTQKATIMIEDEEGNILNANTDPKEVEARVEIGEAGFSVPIRITTEGEQSGVRYNVENLSDTSVKLIGISGAAEGISEVTGTVDVSDMTTSTIVTVPLTVPDGVQSITPQSIRVRVTPSHQGNGNNNSSNANSDNASNADSASDATDNADNNTSDGNEATAEDNSTVNAEETNGATPVNSSHSSESKNERFHFFSNPFRFFSALMA